MGTEYVGAVEVRNLTFSFGVTPVLRGLDLVVEQGSMLTIFGPNGAGKTTLLKVLAGLLRPSQGSVHIEGMDAAKSPRPCAGSLGLYRTKRFVPAANRPGELSSTVACTRWLSLADKHG